MVNFLMKYSSLDRKYSQLIQDEDSTLKNLIEEECAYKSGRVTHMICCEPHGHWKAIWAMVLLSGAVVIIVLSFCLGTVNELASNEFVPRMERKTVVFEETPIFSEPPSAKSDLAWDSLLPPGRGFISVKNPERYGLHRGIETEYGVDRYSVSLFHQLHCLGMIRKTFFEYLSREPQQSQTKSELETATNSTIVHHEMGHINHCYDYLRQAIMCSGDMTLEWAIEESDGSRRQVDGWGIPHRQCKNWTMIWDYMLEHHAANNNTDIA